MSEAPLSGLEQLMLRLSTSILTLAYIDYTKIIISIAIMPMIICKYSAMYMSITSKAY